MILLTEEETGEYLSQCWDSSEGSLFRQWARPISFLQRERGELSPADIWRESTRCIDALRKVKHDRPDYVPILYNRLLKDCLTMQYGKGKPTERNHKKAEDTADLVLAVTAIRLVNCIKPGHEQDPLGESDAIVNDIMTTIGEDTFNTYQNLFLEHHTDDYGNKIVIDQYNVLGDEDIEKSLKTQSQIEREQVLSSVKKHLSPLEALFGKDEYKQLAGLFDNIVNGSDDALFENLKRVKPNKNDWGNINKAMILNIVAMFRDIRIIEANNNQINKAIGGNNNTTYLKGNEPEDGDRSTYGMSKELWKKTKEIIEKL